MFRRVICHIKFNALDHVPPCKKKKAFSTSPHPQLAQLFCIHGGSLGLRRQGPELVQLLRQLQSTALQEAQWSIYLDMADAKSAKVMNR